jgi:hypothetical protein
LDISGEKYIDIQNKTKQKKKKSTKENKNKICEWPANENRAFSITYTLCLFCPVSARSI